MAAACLVWDATAGGLDPVTARAISDADVFSRDDADLAPGYISSILFPLGQHLSCEECKNGLKGRIKEVIVEWSMTKVSLFVTLYFVFCRRTNRNRL